MLETAFNSHKMKLRQNDYLESGWYNIEVEMVSSKLPIPSLSIDLW